MLKSQRKNCYTVVDYLAWPDDMRCELIGGEIYDMSPAPTVAHQDAALGLSSALRAALKTRRSGGGCGPIDVCQVIISPIDVVLDKTTVVQPDIVVVCDAAKLANGRYVDGAPDLVVEVLSPSTALKDRREKRALYEKAGIQEYLLVDPLERYMEVYRLIEGVYTVPLLLGPEDAFQSTFFPDITQTLGELLDWQLPEVVPNPLRD